MLYISSRVINPSLSTSYRRKAPIDLVLKKKKCFFKLKIFCFIWLTVQFFIQIAPWCYGQRPNELLKLNGSILKINSYLLKSPVQKYIKIIRNSHIVLIENTKHQRGKLARIALREKLLVDFNETLEESKNVVLKNRLVNRPNVRHITCSVSNPFGQSLRKPLCL